MSANVAVRCPKCQKALQMEASIVADRFYHPECLKCESCRQKIEQFIFEGGSQGSQTMCKPCFTAKFIPNCTVCQKPIEGKISEMLGQKFHPNCKPLCHRCKKPPSDGQYTESNEKLVCYECFWKIVRDERRQKQQEMTGSPVAVK